MGSGGELACEEYGSWEGGRYGDGCLGFGECAYDVVDGFESSYGEFSILSRYLLADSTLIGSMFFSIPAHTIDNAINGQTFSRFALAMLVSSIRAITTSFFSGS